MKENNNLNCSKTALCLDNATILIGIKSAIFQQAYRDRVCHVLTFSLPVEFSKYKSDLLLSLKVSSTFILSPHLPTPFQYKCEDKDSKCFKI